MTRHYGIPSRSEPAMRGDTAAAFDDAIKAVARQDRRLMAALVGLLVMAGAVLGIAAWEIIRLTA